MAAGPDVIYQATFFDGTWRGHADFLLRVDAPERPSIWGPYHYEVADTKLARHVKASAVLQICSYVDQLERIQGVRPEWLHVALGGSARTVERLRVDDYMAYYRSARDRFLATLADEAPATYPPATTYPEPVEHCDVCRWAAECAARRRARRPPEPGRRHLGPAAAGARRAGRRNPRGTRRSHPADGAATRRGRRGRARPRSRTGEDPAGGPPRGQSQVRAASFRRAGRSRSTAGWRPSRAIARRPVLRHRGRSVRLRRWARLPLRPARRGWDVHRDLVARRCERVHARRRAARIRAARRRHHRPPRTRTRRCTSTTTHRTSRPRSSA